MEKSDSDHEHLDESSSDEEPIEIPTHRPKADSSRQRSNRQPLENMGELYGSVEGPINPVNYTGTQINVWGFPTPDLAAFLQKKKPETQVGFLTDQMIKVIIFLLLFRLNSMIRKKYFQYF